MKSMLDENDFLAVINTVCKCLYSGILATSGGKGEVGELLAAIIFCRAFDTASKSLSEYETSSNFFYNIDAGKKESKSLDSGYIYAHPVPLICFLEKLYSRSHFNDIQQNIKNHKTILKSFVHFTHFIKVAYKVSKNDLNQYLKRGAAIICNNNEKGADILIPLAIAKDKFALDLGDFNSYNVSCLIVQIKNINDNINVEEIVENLFLNNLFVEFEEEGILKSALFIVQNVNDHGHTFANNQTYLPFKSFFSESVKNSIFDKKNKEKDKSNNNNTIVENKVKNNTIVENKVKNNTIVEKKVNKPVINISDKLKLENGTDPRNDMFVLLLFGVGDFNKFEIPCLSKQATDILKKMCVVQPQFEDYVAAHNFSNRKSNRETAIEKKKKLLVLEYNSKITEILV
jgi:hypothetical protein